jgi:hypothetical protein
MFVNHAYKFLQTVMICTFGSRTSCFFLFFSLLPHLHFEVKIRNPTNKISVALLLFIHIAVCLAGALSMTAHKLYFGKIKKYRFFSNTGFLLV